MSLAFTHGYSILQLQDFSTSGDSATSRAKLRGWDRPAWLRERVRGLRNSAVVFPLGRCPRPPSLRRVCVGTCPTERLAIVHGERPRTLHSAMPNDRARRRHHGCPGVNCTVLSSFTAISSGAMSQWEATPSTLHDTMLSDRVNTNCLNSEGVPT